MTVAMPALAEEPRALVVGVPDPTAPMAFAESYNVAQALRGAGLQDVTLLRDVSEAELAATWDRVDPDLFYLSGPFPESLADRLEGEDRPDILLLDDCAAPVTVRGDGVARASDADLCDNGGLAAMISRASNAQIARDFNGVLRGAWSGAPPEAFTIERAEAPARLSAGPVAVVAEAVVAVSPISPVSSASVSGSALTGTAPEGVDSDESIAIFLNTPASQQAALPTPEGFPEPSIILGVIAPTPASFPVADESDPGTAADAASELAGAEISYQNLEARRALKESDPQLFETLVAGGAFDPPDVELALALQTELRRMGCYRSTLDGIWGNGSRGAVNRYWDQLNETGGVEPTIELFRQIMRKDDVICPAPAVVATPRATSSGGGTRNTASRPTRTQQAAPARTQTRQQAPARTQQRTLRGSGSLLGTFR